MSNREQVVVLRSDGDASFLFADDHPGHALGEMVRADRASDVVFDTARRGWVIQYRAPYEHLYTGWPFARREDAVREEIRAINEYELWKGMSCEDLHKG